jgi:general stress protein CsbA
LKILENAIKLLILLSILSVFFHPSAQKALGMSPSFVRQEIKDDPRDWWDHEKEQFSNVMNFSDISAVSYSSDGQFLNATVFTSDVFVKEPSKYMPAYGMLINADSDLNTGYLGHDYLLRILWNNETKTWDYKLAEWSIARVERILYQKSNYTDFFDEGEGNRYVHLSLNLANINFPQQYVVLFFVDYDFDMSNSRKGISDYSNWVNIPPLKFAISTSPSTITLRPGEEKTIEVQVNSTTPTATSFVTPYVSFSTNKIDAIENASFIPNGLALPRFGIGASELHIKASKNAEPSYRTLQILGNVSFPVQYVRGSNETSELSTAKFESMTVNTNLAVTTLKALTSEEKFSNFWNVYGDAINLVAGGLVAGFSAIVIDKVRRRMNKKKGKNNA